MNKILPLILTTAVFVSQNSEAIPVQFAVNGNYYDFIASSDTYNAAKTAAAALTYNSIQGHLVTITSQSENDFLGTNFANQNGFAWIGATDQATEGTWLWDAGPEIGVQFSNVAAPTPPFNYENWQNIEPNDSGGQDFAVFHLGGFGSGTAVPFLLGEWGDVNNSGQNITIGYLVEYEASNVLEPTTIALIGIGLAGLGFRRKNQV